MDELERRIRQAFPDGQEVDAANLPPDQRTVGGEVIASILRAEVSTRSALKLGSAHITGQLQLGFADIACPIIFEDCTFEQAPDFYWARVDHLRMVACRLPGLYASNIQVARHLQLSGSIFDGEVRLRGAKIAGGLLLDGARITALDGDSLKAERVEIGGDLFLKELTARGQVRLYKTTVGGNLVLDKAVIETNDRMAISADSLAVSGGVYGREARITGEFSIRHAHIGDAFTLSGTTLSYPDGVALRADRATFEGGVWMLHPFTAEGQIRLIATTIGRGLILRGAVISAPGKEALRVNGATIDSNIDARNLRVAGGVHLSDSTIAGPVIFEGAQISNPDGDAFIAYGVRTNSIFNCCEGFRAEGRIGFSGAQIGGTLCFNRATLSAPGRVVLKCWRLDTPELAIRWDTPPVGVVDLRFAKVGLLRDDPAKWPDQVRLDGMTYDAVEPTLDAAARMRLLLRDQDGYRPQPYEQLAQVCRRLGHDDDARMVLMAKQRRMTAGLSRTGRAWGWLQDVVVGYGYRPMRATLWLLLLLTIGSVSFTLQPPAAIEPDKAPPFDAVVYTVDVLVPIVDFGQQSAYHPVGGSRWLMYALVAAGLILATTVAAGVARSLRRD